MFVNIGVEPASELVADFVERDADGRIVVDISLSTSVPGVFAAGGVRSGTVDQLITAAADGVTAALSANAWLARGVG